VTEAEWLVCDDPQKMRWYLRYEAEGNIEQPSERKLRLWACACCRLNWHNLTDKRSKAAVEWAERLADALVTEEEVFAADEQANAAIPDHLRSIQLLVEIEALNPEEQIVYYSTASACSVIRYEDGWNFYDHLEDVIRNTLEVVKNQGVSPTKQVIADIGRDIIGNPFHPVKLDPAWQTSKVVSVAKAIYEGRAFDRLPMLADALEEAGCHDADILAHSRSTGEHVRGCWAVDLILGKE
jgi:hypothetical protein